MTAEQSQAWLSALRDDALDQWPLDAVIDDGVLAQWQALVSVGQALSGTPVDDAAAARRMVLAVRAATAGAAAAPRWRGVTASRLRGLSQAAANYSRFAGAWAAVLVIAVGVWLAWPSPTEVLVANGGETDAAATAQALAQAEAVRVDQDGVIRDPRLDALLHSHRQSGGAWALQDSAGFVRGVVLQQR